MTIPAAVRREVAERYGLEPGGEREIQCAYCPARTVAYWPLGGRGNPSYWPMFGRGFALDHVHPRAKGGADSADNLVVACVPCNSRKRDRFREDLRNDSGNDSAPVPGTIPQGKGREGKRKGMERNATAILLVVKSCKSAIKFNSATREEVELDGSH